MKYTILIASLMFSISQAAVSTVKLEKASLITSKGNIELNVQADEDIMGIQFDMKYNVEELKFKGANVIPNNMYLNTRKKIMESLEASCLVWKEKN